MQGTKRVRELKEVKKNERVKRVQELSMKLVVHQNYLSCSEANDTANCCKMFQRLISTSRLLFSATPTQIQAFVQPIINQILDDKLFIYHAQHWKSDQEVCEIKLFMCKSAPIKWTVRTWMKLYLQFGRSLRICGFVKKVDEVKTVDLDANTFKLRETIIKTKQPFQMLESRQLSLSCDNISSIVYDHLFKILRDLSLQLH